MARNTATGMRDDDPSLASVLEECPYPIFRLGPGGRVLYANAATQGSADLLEDGGTRANAEIRRIVADVLGGGQSRRLDLRADGRIYNALFNAEPGRGHVNAYLRDVTEIRGAERSLADAARFPLENPNPVLRIRPDRSILLANAIARSVPGLIEAGPPERLADQLAPLVEDVILTHASRHSEYHGENGTTFLLNFAYIADADYINVYGRDITQELEAKRELQEANDLLERRVAERTASVRLLQNIVLAANSATSFETAMQTALHEVCLFTGWAVGHAYVVTHTGRATRLVPTGIWHVDQDHNIGRLRDAVARDRFDASQGLPGRAVRQRQAAWIEDVAADRRFRRRAFCKEAGLASAMAFPVILHDRVVGVLEFFARQPTTADVDIIQVLGHVGTLLGSVAERTEAEAALSRSREEAAMAHSRLMDAIENVGQAIALFDAQDHLVLFNRSYQQIYADFTGGQRPKVGQPFETWLHPSARRMFPEMTAQERQQWVQGVLANRRANKTRLSTDRTPSGRWLRSEGFCTSDSGSVSVFTDITEAKRHEDELAALAREAELSHQRLSELLESVGQAIVLFDSEDRIVLMNAAYRDLFREFSGGTVPEIGMAFEEGLRRSVPLMHPDMSPDEQEAWVQRVLKNRRENKVRLSQDYVPATGRWTRSEGFPMSDGGTVSVFTDITEAKRHEEELARLAREAELAHQRLTDALEVVDQGFALYDKDDRLIAINRRARDQMNQLVQKGQEFQIGETFESFFRRTVNPFRKFETEADLEAWRAQVLHRRRTEKVRRSVDQTGNGRWVRSEGYETREGGIVSIWTDITEAKKHEEELDALVKELGVARDAAVQANAAKSQFLANMSHELRTPLNAIIGYSELLIDEVTDEGHDDYVPDLQKIERAGKHLLGLINDILDLSKIEVGKVELYVEDLHLDQLLDDVAATIQPVIEKNRNRLEIVNRVGARLLHGDQTKLRQNLFNLLSNAAKFCEDGRIRVTASLTGKGRMLKVEVSDQGIGMSPEQLGRVFEPFTQADASTSRKYGGTGLGLTITREFCRMMGGDLTVVSTLGKGTTFTMTVLADARGLAVRPAPAEVAQPVADDAPLVLIIDDDAVVRELLRRNLNAAGYRTIEAADGRAGIALARESRPELITLDVIMPATDGWAVLAELKSAPETEAIPVVMVTILEDRNLGFSLGASEYVTKPIDRDRLLGSIGRLVGRAEAASVLVVEDDEDTRELLARLLGEQGFGVVTAENGKVALERLKEMTPGIVLLDLMMPEMDGFEFAEIFRTRPEWATIPVIVVTAKTLTAEDRHRLEGWVEALYAKGGTGIEAVIAEVRTRLGAVPGQAGGAESGASGARP